LNSNALAVLEADCGRHRQRSRRSGELEIAQLRALLQDAHRTCAVKVVEPSHVGLARKAVAQDEQLRERTRKRLIQRRRVATLRDLLS
jgi:hypothetical protein